MKSLIQIVSQQKPSAVQAFKNQWKKAEELSGPLRFFFIGHRKGGMARTAVGKNEGGPVSYTHLDNLTKSDIEKMQEEIEYRKLVVRKEALEAVKEARAHGDPVSYTHLQGGT